MAIGDRQNLITNIVSIVLGESAQTKKKFDWFINKHLPENFGDRFSYIDKIFKTLKGNTVANQDKRTTLLECDAYFGGKYNFIFEFDEFQHFSSARFKTLDLYPQDLQTNFSLTDWKRHCQINKDTADKYRQNKVTVDFDFNGGRTAQRAYLDCFRDLLPKHNGLNPTLRITELDVGHILTNTPESCKKIEKILSTRLH
jgi:hypothetical protein